MTERYRIFIICAFAIAFFTAVAQLRRTYMPSSNLQTTVWKVRVNEEKSQEDEKPPGKRRKKAAMCTIVKNEEAYIDEWVDYHLALGFDPIYIYDNSDEFEMRQWGNETKGDHVRVIHFPGQAVQMKAYLDCAKKLTRKKRKKTTWAAFFDVDEFLVLKKHDHVSDFLEDHCPHGEIGINWFMFGASSRNLYAPLPVTKRFTYREPKVNQHIKSIVRLADMNMQKLGGVHHVLLNKGNQHDTNGRKFVGPFNPDGPTDVSVIHHYHTKSHKEYIYKRLRGRADTSWKKGNMKTALKDAKKGLEKALAGVEVNMNYTFDDTGWTLMKKYVPIYAMFDEI